jgi:hypothetical protein
MEVSKKATAFFFKGNKTFLVVPEPKMMALPSFDTSTTIYESTRRETPEESNLQVTLNFAVKVFAMKLNASSAVSLNLFLHMASLRSSLIETKPNFVDNLDYPMTKIFFCNKCYYSQSSYNSKLYKL